MSSIQLENINKIKYLKSVLDRVSSYGIDVSSYFNELNTIIDDYEDDKKIELDKEDDKIKLTMDSEPEFDLGVELEVFSVKIDWCILVLSLIDSTDSWNLDVNIDKVFFSVYNKIDNILEYISDVDIQEKIVIRYYDLVLKKILKDYDNKVYEYLDEYNDIDKYVYLMDSIKRYLESKNIVLEDSINSYNLEDIIKKVYNGKSSKKEKSLESIEDSTKKDIVIVDDKKTSVVKVNNNSFFDNVRNFWMNKFYYIKSLSELGDVDINNEVDMGVLILNDIFNIDRDFIKKFIEDNQDDFSNISYVFNIRNFYMIKNEDNVDAILEDLIDKDDKCKILNFIGKLLLIEIFTLRKNDEIEINDSIENKVIDFSWIGNISTLINILNVISLNSKDIFDDSLYNMDSLIGIISNKYFGDFDIYDSFSFFEIDLSAVDFSGANFGSIDLKNTKARIDPQKTNIGRAALQGCYVINNFKGREIEIGIFRDYHVIYTIGNCRLNGAILVDSFDEIEELERKLEHGIDDRFIFDWDLVDYDYESNSFVRKDKKIKKLEKK